MIQNQGTLGYRKLSCPLFNISYVRSLLVTGQLIAAIAMYTKMILLKMGMHFLCD